MSNQTEVKGLDEQLKSNTSNILILVTRDGRINITHTLARQISPVLGGFIDNWNKDNNEFYLNFSSKEVNNLLDTYNAKGTLKDYLLCDAPKKKLTLLDILDNPNILNEIMQIRIVNDELIYRNADGKDITESYSIHVFINDKHQHWVFGFDEDDKKYKIYLRSDKFHFGKNPKIYDITLPEKHKQILKKADHKKVKQFMFRLFKSFPHLLRSYFD